MISSDLSHFLPYATRASRGQRDRASTSCSCSRRSTTSRPAAARPVNGLLLAARQHHLQPQLLDLCNSGDTAGDKERVVGYAAIAFTQEQRMRH